MLPMQPEKENHIAGNPAGPSLTGPSPTGPSPTGPTLGTSRFAALARWGRRRGSGLPLILLFVALAACAPGDVPPPAICDTYSRALFTTQLMGGAVIILGLAVLGFKKNLSAILPSQGAQVGAIAGSVILGLVLLAFSTDIGNQMLAGFGIESLFILCGL